MDAEEAFLNEISQLGRQDSVILEIDSSEEGAGIRQQQRTDELQSLLAIFGSEMEVVDHDLIRFLVYQDKVLYLLRHVGQASILILISYQ